MQCIMTSLDTLMMYFYVYVLYRYAALQYPKTLVSSVVKRSGDVDCASVLWHEELQHSWQPIVNDSPCSMTIFRQLKVYIDWI